MFNPMLLRHIHLGDPAWVPYFKKEGDKMKNMIAVADAVNTKIDRIIKVLEKTKDCHEVSYFITILECLKVYNININTDREVYIMFKDKEVMKLYI